MSGPAEQGTSGNVASGNDAAGEVAAGDVAAGNVTPGKGAAGDSALALQAGETLLLLIRHGETEWNQGGRIQGHIDTPLSPRGERQARVLARHLAGQPLTAVYASDLLRARSTAEPLLEGRGLVLQVDPRLRERGFGLFEGHTYAEAEARWPAEYAIWKRREPGHAVPGGESFLQARERVLDSLQAMLVRHAGGVVAAVTHGGVLDIVYRTALAIPWETPRSHLLPNASVNRVAALAGAGTNGAAVPALRVLAWAQRAHLDAALDEIDAG
jgi:probable phosphoglycerate mutase